MQGVFEGETINTPSMLCVEDYLDALAWAESIGGLKALFARADANAKVLYDWAERTPLAREPGGRPGDALQHLGVPEDRRSGGRQAAGRCAARLRQAARGAARQGERGAATSPAIAMRRRSLRIWCGSTVETADVEALTPWLDWAFAEAKAGLAKAA